jgi:hypothetical protein
MKRRKRRGTGDPAAGKEKRSDLPPRKRMSLIDNNAAKCRPSVSPILKAVYLVNGNFTRGAGILPEGRGRDRAVKRVTITPSRTHGRENLRGARNGGLRLIGSSSLEPPAIPRFCPAYGGP